MKSATKHPTELSVLLDTSMKTERHLSSSSSATTKATSTHRPTPSKARTGTFGRSNQAQLQQYLSKSMEKTFRRMTKGPATRDAYVKAEIVTALAHQIRAIRSQRGWSQRDLAKRLGTTQAAVSRMEDPSYGRFSVSTLMELAKVFDVGLQVKFISFVSMLEQTFKPKHADRLVPSFEEEAPFVSFFSEKHGDFIRFNAQIASRSALQVASDLKVPTTTAAGIIIRNLESSSSSFVPILIKEYEHA